MKRMNVKKAIYERKSIRLYTGEKIPNEHIMEIINCGKKAPSGKNLKPWKFIVLDDDRIRKLGETSRGNRWLANAGAVIFVLFDTEKSYDYVKDMQSCGAAMENMLLMATSLGYGACWIGEYTESSEKDVWDAIKEEKENKVIACAMAIGKKI